MPAYKDEKRGTWYFSTYPPKGYPGSRNKKMLRGFRTKRDALKAEREWLNECERVMVGDVTFEEVMEHKFRFKESAPSTAIGDRSNYKNHFEPIVKNKPIKHITVDDMMALKEALEKTDLKGNSKRTIYTSISSVYEHAMVHFNLPFNPARRVKGYKRVKSKNNFMTMTELYNNVDRIQGEQFRQVTIFLANTGLRIGEVQALTWKDINFKDRYIDVHKKYNRKTKQIEDYTKSDASTALVYFPEVVYDILVDIRNEDYQYYKYFNDGYYVFGGMDILKYHNYLYHFKKVFPDHRIQDLRHTYASYLESVDTSFSVMKEMLRHADISTTVNTYTHNYPEAQRRAIESLDKAKQYHTSITEDREGQK